MGKKLTSVDICLETLLKDVKYNNGFYINNKYIEVKDNLPDGEYLTIDRLEFDEFIDIGDCASYNGIAWTVWDICEDSITLYRKFKQVRG